MAWSPPFFSSPGTVLTGAHYGGVEHHVFVVVIGSQHIEDTLKNTAFGPTHPSAKPRADEIHSSPLMLSPHPTALPVNSNLIVMIEATFTGRKLAFTPACAVTRFASQINEKNWNYG